MSKPGSTPHSPSLEPPRKSIELEDPGAHDLDSSEAEEEVFADAQEDTYSHSTPNSPIPTTRVERVDDRENYGEVPGTAAYKLREQDAVPDEVEVVSEEKPYSRRASQASSRPLSPSDMPVPTTIVEKIDPQSPSHGEIPGTAAHAKRMADAVPDVIKSRAEKEASTPRPSATPKSPEVPTTVITKVDSSPSHGEVPGTEAFEMRRQDAQPDVVEKKDDAHSEADSTKLSGRKGHLNVSSPIAADGGFGPMTSDSEESDEPVTESASQEDTAEHSEEELGDDFDDFEAGTEQDEFGEFDEAAQTPSISNTTAPEPEFESPPRRNVPVIDIPYPLLDFGELDRFDDIQNAVSHYLDDLLPNARSVDDDTTLPSPNKSLFLTDRSHSLWTQLVAPPPLQPPNWVRSRIRRLFLVSLGVPVDLDEILPASKQKKLILPSIHIRSDSPSSTNGARQSSRVRLKHENASSTSVDKAGGGTKGKRRKGPPSAPEIDIQAARMLCATTAAALSSLTDEELDAHRQKLTHLTARASEVLEYWLKRRDAALDEQSTFESVIENLVKHARRVRK